MSSLEQKRKRGRPPGTGKPASYQITKAVNRALDGMTDTFSCSKLYVAPHDADPKTIDAQLAGIENVFKESSDWVTLLQRYHDQQLIIDELQASSYEEIARKLDALSAESLHELAAPSPVPTKRQHNIKNSPIYPQSPSNRPHGAPAPPASSEMEDRRPTRNSPAGSDEVPSDHRHAQSEAHHDKRRTSVSGGIGYAEMRTIVDPEGAPRPGRPEGWRPGINQPEQAFDENASTEASRAEQRHKKRRKKKSRRSSSRLEEGRHHLVPYFDTGTVLNA